MSPGCPYVPAGTGSQAPTVLGCLLGGGIPTAQSSPLAHLNPTGVQEKSDLWVKEGLVHLLGTFGSHWSSSQLKLTDFPLLKCVRKQKDLAQPPGLCFAS